jgi:hypothetical protein
MTGTIRKCKSATTRGKKLSRRATAMQAFGDGGGKGEKWAGHNRAERKGLTCTSAKCTSAKCTSAKLRRDRKRERGLKDFTLSEQLGDDGREWWAAVQDSDAVLFPTQREMAVAEECERLFEAEGSWRHFQRRIVEIKKELDLRKTCEVDEWDERPQPIHPSLRHLPRREFRVCDMKKEDLILQLVDCQNEVDALEEVIRLLEGGSPRVIETVPPGEVVEKRGEVSVVAVAARQVRDDGGRDDETSDSDDDE